MTLINPLSQQSSGPVVRHEILVCDGSACGCTASLEVLAALQRQVARRGLAEDVRVTRTACRGLCAVEPVVIILPRGVLYCRVEPTDAGAIVEETLVKNQLLARLLYEEPPAVSEITPYSQTPFFSRQVRVALSNCGLVDPESIVDYIVHDGYRGLAKALLQMSPEQVIEEMKLSGLRGRGGAGFPTGVKWELCRKSPGDIKYVICNGDEGDPGAFMDRSILESDPHSVLEGMAIAARAIGARRGFIYCREEYPLAISRLETAIQQAYAHGLLGQKILGSDFSFDIEIKEGAGAFVCGEETALIASIEGRRGEPRPRPPFPAQRGLWGKPSNINNVKSYAMAPRIIFRGARWFSGIGTPRSPGTAIFALTGKINNTGLIEVPMGIPLGDIIFDVGGGVPQGRMFKAVQTGGPLGGCLPVAALNTPVDFDSLAEAGAVMGSGGMIVVDEDTCMVELAKYFLDFAAAESCGKCVPCRVGGQRLLDALNRITSGQGSGKDLQIIKNVAAQMQEASLCGLGQRTPGPIMASLRFFEQEFAEHVEDKLCAAGQCRPLVRARCVNACPAGVDTPAYLALVARGDFEQALEIHRQRNPFAHVCGRACPAFCEKRCRRAELDQPVAVRLIKRFMADHELEKPWTPTVQQDPVRGQKRIAVIGAGPAGLTAALRLAEMGYQVTVYEKYPTPGGMLTWAIPEYRLPRGPVMAEIDNIRRAGVEIVCGKALGVDFTLDELQGRMGFSAVILAIGAHRSRKLGIPGDDKRGVIYGLDFLREVASHKPSFDLAGQRVGIVGGGDVAVDVARCALRMGAAQAHVLYRRTGEHMPAAHLPDEIEAAMQEGVQFHTLVSPVEVVGEERVQAIRVQRQNLGEFDSSGRRRPVGAADDCYAVQLDWLVPAVGQTPDLACLPANSLRATSSSALVVGNAYDTSRPGVFAAGDAVLGPSTIIQAVAQGNLVAVAVDDWLRSGELRKPHFVTPRHDIPLQPEGIAGDLSRHPTPRLPLDRRNGFDEVEIGFDEASARSEARRCLRCDLEWLDMMNLPRPAQPAEVTP